MIISYLLYEYVFTDHPPFSLPKNVFHEYSSKFCAHNNKVDTFKRSKAFNSCVSNIKYFLHAHITSEARLLPLNR